MKDKIVKTLREIIQERVLILDGAMGTLIGSVVGKVGNTDALNLTQPEVVSDQPLALNYMQ